jgi:uncharacterized protein (TIGR03083 family)
MFLDAIRAESAALASAARKGLDAPVPSCPDWDVRELVLHTARVHRWVTEIVRTRAQERPERFPARPDGDIADWFERGADTLIVTLEAVDPDEPLWNWSRGPQAASFWPRRMAQETAMHRWDGESAHGSATPIDSALAVDGINEMFDVFLSSGRLADDATLSGSLHLHAIDADGEWLVRIDGGKLAVTHEHAKGDAAVRGSASDLLLFVWNRVPASSLEVFGDDDVVRRWSDIKI